MVETAERFAITFFNGALPAPGNAVHELKDKLEARDAAIAHEARVGVLRELLACYAKDSPTSYGSNYVRGDIKGVAHKHNITPAELEPPKPYTEADVKVEQDRFENWLVRCGACYAEPTRDGFRWSRETYSFSLRCVAEAIAAKLRADGNYPGGGE